MIKRMTFFMSLLLCSVCQSQTFPPEVKSMMEANKPKGSAIYVDKLEKSEREFYWKGITRNPAGYFEITVDASDIKLIQRMKRHMTDGAYPKDFRNVVNLSNSAEPKYIGEMSESNTRSTMFFRDKAGADVMLTASNFAAAGTNVWIIRELLNVSVNGAKGTLTLSLPKTGSQVLWTLAWESKGINYELCISDNVDKYRRPSKRPEDILNIAQEIVRE
jgi:hypothetical protein